MTAWPPAPRDPEEPGPPRPPEGQSPLEPGQPAPAAPRPALQGVRLPLHKPVITYVLMGLISLVFVGQLASEYLLGEDWLIQFGAKINGAIAAGEIWRLVTPIFLHANLLHFFFNMYALYNLGRSAEGFLGPARYTLLFFYAGIAGTVFSMLFTPAPSVGASGAIFGLIGAEAVFLYRNRQLFGERGRRGLQQVVIIALINLAFGLQAGIDNWGHLGGLIGGAALGWILAPVWRLEPSAVAPGTLTVIDDQAQNSTAGVLFAGLIVALGAIILIAVTLAR